MASSPISSWQIDWETMKTVTDFIFLGSRITAYGDCSHEIKRCLPLGRKAMTNLDSIFKSRDIALPTKIHLVKAMVFSSESVLRIRWPKYWRFSFSNSSSSEYSGLISFRIDWFNLLAVQGTLKSLLQHHNSKVSVLQHLAFFMVQLSHLTWLMISHSFDCTELCWQY